MKIVYKSFLGKDGLLDGLYFSERFYILRNTSYFKYFISNSTLYYSVTFDIL